MEEDNSISDESSNLISDSQSSSLTDEYDDEESFKTDSDYTDTSTLEKVHEQLNSLQVRIETQEQRYLALEVDFNASKADIK